MLGLQDDNVLQSQSGHPVLSTQLVLPACDAMLCMHVHQALLLLWMSKAR